MSFRGEARSFITSRKSAFSISEKAHHCLFYTLGPCPRLPDNVAIGHAEGPGRLGPLYRTAFIL